LCPFQNSFYFFLSPNRSRFPLFSSFLLFFFLKAGCPLFLLPPLAYTFFSVIESCRACLCRGLSMMPSLTNGFREKTPWQGSPHGSCFWGFSQLRPSFPPHEPDGSVLSFLPLSFFFFRARYRSLTRSFLLSALSLSLLSSPPSELYFLFCNGFSVLCTLPPPLHEEGRVSQVKKSPPPYLRLPFNRFLL